MAFAIAGQVLFLAGPRPRYEGGELPEDWVRAGMDGMELSIDSMQAMLQASLEEHGGVLVPIGPPTWAVVKLLYQQNILRGMVRSPHPNHVN